MPLIGQVGEFKPGSNWDEYIEILDIFFGANDIANDEKKRHVFLATVGPDTYHLISTLTAPEKPATKSFSELVSLVKRHIDPAPSRIVSRFKYYSIKRK